MSEGIEMNAEGVVEYLNDILETDADSLKKLIEFRVDCNDDLMAHENVLVLCDHDSKGNPVNPRVGLLGVLNGMLGLRESGMGQIAAEFDEDGHLHRFVVITEENE